MDTLINALKDHQLSKWCKRAAWIILLIGLVQDACSAYIQIHIRDSFGISGLSLTWEQVQVFSALLANLPTILFYFFTLYALGAFVQHVFGDKQSSEEAGEEPDGSDDDEEADEEELVPGQMPSLP